MTDPQAKPFALILRENFARYGCPIFIAETGIEADLRPIWLRYVGGEVRTAIRQGDPIHAIR